MTFRNQEITLHFVFLCIFFSYHGFDWIKGTPTQLTEGSLSILELGWKGGTAWGPQSGGPSEVNSASECSDAAPGVCRPVVGHHVMLTRTVFH